MARISFGSDKFNDWTIEGDVLFPLGGKANITNVINPGIYRLIPSPRPMDPRVGLSKVDDKFNLGLPKIYKTGGEEIIEVMKKTWENGSFRRDKKNLCCIFNGTKGTG